MLFQVGTILVFVPYLPKNQLSQFTNAPIQLTPVAFLLSRLFPSLSLFNSVSWAFTRIHFGGKIPDNFEIIKKGE